MSPCTKFLFPSPTTLGNDNHTRRPSRAMPPGYHTRGHLMRAQRASRMDRYNGKERKKRETCW
ncbi:hypothetical protein LB503_006242 [Fusarium chuoi]|nr:hypothetical protein LB503_006242 [Fusarium chuoi]